MGGNGQDDCLLSGLCSVADNEMRVQLFSSESFAAHAGLKDLRK